MTKLCGFCSINRPVIRETPEAIFIVKIASRNISLGFEWTPPRATDITDISENQLFELSFGCYDCIFRLVDYHSCFFYLFLFCSFQRHRIRQINVPLHYRAISGNDYRYRQSDSSLCGTQVACRWFLRLRAIVFEWIVKNLKKKKKKSTTHSGIKRRKRSKVK